MIAKLIVLPITDQVPTRESIKSLVYDVRSCMQDARNAALQYALRIGRDLLELKEICRTDGIGFGTLFPQSEADRDDPTKLPFVQNTGIRLMAIARHDLLSNAEHVHKRLPTDWGSLYQLARLPAPKLKKLIATGEVSADMSRAAATKLAKENTMPTSKATNEKSQSSKAAMSKREAARTDFIVCLKRLKVKTRIEEVRELAQELGLEITIRSKS